MLSTQPRSARARAVKMLEQLEARTMFNATTGSAIATVSVPAGSTVSTVDLNQHFSDPGVTGTAVLMQTNEGNIPLTLFDSQVSTTVQNFLHYVNSGEYNNTFIHRVVTMNTGGIGIVQGGGYTTDGNSIPTAAPIPLQYQIPNSLGTISMARTSDPNSATSEWFFNTADNSQTLGASNGGGYAVFGKVLYNGMTTLNSIYNLPLGSYTTSDGPMTSVPLSDTPSGAVAPSDLVVIQQASVVSPLTYTATSDTPGLVTPSISGGTLSLNYAAGQAGVAHVTVTATDLGGNQASLTFQVNVGSTIGAGGAKQIRFTDADGTATVISLAGPGSASVAFSGADIGQTLAKNNILTVTGTGLQASSVNATGTTAASTLNITGHGGNGTVEIGTLTTDGSFKAVNAPQASFSNGMTIAGTLGKLTLADLTGGTIVVNGTSGTLSVKINTVTGGAIQSGEAVQIQGTAWGTSSAVAVSSPSISKLNVKGQLTADITAGALGATTAGSIAGGIWSISGAVTKLSAGSISGLTLTDAQTGAVVSRGAVEGLRLNSAGDITSVTAASLGDSTIFAGVGGNSLPAGAGDFTAAATIKTVKVRGVFSNSDIAAASQGKLSLGTILSSNNGIPFGLAAQQIVGLTALVDGKKLALKNVTTADQVSAAFAAAGITPNDLVVRII